MPQVSPTLFASFLAQVQSLYERLSPPPPETIPPESPVITGKIDPLRLTAGFDDARLARRVAEVTAAEARLANDGATGLQRRRLLLNHLHRAAVAGRPFDPCLLANLLLLMDTPDAKAFLGRWGRGEFTVIIHRDADMDARLRAGGYRPAGQISFYSPAAPGLPPRIFLRDLSPMDRKVKSAEEGARRQSDWVKSAFERLLGAFHEEDHFLQFSSGHGGRKNFLVNETMALLREYEIRLSLGDASIGQEAARRNQTAAEYLCACAAADVPGNRFSRWF